MVTLTSGMNDCFEMVAVEVSSAKSNVSRLSLLIKFLFDDATSSCLKALRNGKIIIIL
jgi:hypothetical protein